MNNENWMSMDRNFDEDYFIKDANENKSRDKKYFVLIIYDISENKRRNKMVKVLNSYGFRVQKSAFEALIRPNKYKKLLSDIERIPDTCDSVRVYKIQGKGTVEIFGETFTANDEDDEVVII